MDASVDITLCARADGVLLCCLRCGYEELIATAPPGLDRARAARLAAFEHCWSQHRIGAWSVRFQEVR